MWNPIDVDPAVAADDPAIALTQPAAVGDKQPCYLLITSPTTACSLTKDAATAASGLNIGIAETWVAGPILGADLPNWGLFAAAAIADVSITTLSGKLGVEPRAQALSVHDAPAKTPLLEFIWRKLV